MKSIRLLPCLLAALLNSGTAPAQTATWIGSDLTSAQDWNDGTNWDTGVAPNATTAIAVINDPADATSSTGSIQISSTTVDLAELRFGTSTADDTGTLPRRLLVTAPYALPPAGSTLNLHGVGITTANGADGNPPYTVSVGMGSQLHFYNSAGIDGTNVSIGFEGSGSGFSGAVAFHDQSSAGRVAIFMQGSGVGLVSFDGQSSAATATIQADSLTFADQSTAANAHITTYAFGSTVVFRDQASAGQASINLSRYGSVTFSDQADAGTTTVSCSLESGGVFIRDQAVTSGLTIASFPDSGGASGGRLDISGASGGVTVRGLDGGVRVNLGANTLTLGPAVRDQKLGGAITGTGGLVLDTDRVVSVTRSDNSYTGPTDVRSGTLHLASGRISATTVAAQAALTGAGTIAGDLLNHGSVRPATPQGQPLTVQGNFTQTGSGALAVRLASPGSYDQLAVAGAATLDGALLISVFESLPSVGDARYAFLTAQEVAGTFASVSGVPSDLPMLHYRLVYTTQDVALEIAQQSFAAVALTPAQRALGAHLDATLGAATGGYRTILLILNTRPTTAEVVAGLSQLAPDRYAVLSEEAFSAATARQSAIDRRLTSLRRTHSAGQSGGEVFFEGGQRRTTYLADDGLGKVEFRSNSGLAGAAWSRDRWTFGATVASGRSAADLDRLGSNMKVRSVAPGLFAQYTSGAFFLHATATTSHDEYTLQRDTSLVGYSATATAQPDGSRTDLALTAGYGFTRGGWTITPSFGLLGSQLKVDDFSETLASGNPGSEMTVTDWSVRSLRSRAGFDLAYRSSSGALVPRLGVMWLHEFERDRGFTARLAAAPAASAYRASGRPAETDLVQADIGLDWRISRRLGFSANAGLARGRNTDIVSDFSAGFRWEF